MKYQILTQRPKKNDRCVVCREDVATYWAVLLKAIVVRHEAGSEIKETVWGVAHEHCAGGELKKKSYGLIWTGPETLEVMEALPDNVNVVSGPSSENGSTPSAPLTEDVLRRIIREELELALRPATASKPKSASKRKR